MATIIRLVDWIRGGVSPRGASKGDSTWSPIPCSVTPWTEFAARHYDRAFHDGLHAVPPLLFADRKIFSAVPAR